MFHYTNKNVYLLPQWSDLDLTNKGIFYRDIQDINIYVEDENSEIFYEELFKNLIDNNIKIKKIISLNGRKNVIEFSKIYKDNKAALFIIDADLYLARGERINSIQRLYEHNRYCIENFLFSLSGLVEIIYETLASKTKEKIKEEILWDDVNNNIKNTLVNLFIEFSIIHKLDRSIQTVKIGIKDLFKSHNQSDYLICEEKVNKLIEKKKIELLMKNALKYNKLAKEYTETKKNILEKLSTLGDEIHIISGKHFLIHILFRLMKKHANSQITMESFKLRLAKHYEPEVLESLKFAIEKTVKGEIYISDNL